MGPLGKRHIPITHLVSMIYLVHLSKVFLPNGDFLINQRMVTLVFHLDKFTLSGEKHTHTETLRGTVGITELQSLRSLEGCGDVIGEIAICVSIPRTAILGIEIA